MVYTESDDVTAKDSFLKNPDLMAITISHLNVECLCNVALTCKDFLEVALDKLWEKMDSLVPLLKVLPALRYQYTDYVYVLKGNVPQGDWDRLQYYSRKVKSLTFRDTDQPSIDSSTYDRIAQLQPSDLFPSLRHIHYNLADTSKPHTLLPSFLSPLLDSLELVNIRGFESTIVGPFLTTLSSKSQIPSRIVLRDGQMSVDILKNSIVHFKQLRSLELSDAILMSDFTLLEALGTLPYLANFSFKAFDPASHPARAPANTNGRHGGSKYFDALESLFVKGSFFLVKHLLGFIDSPCLKSIEFYPVINRVHNDDLEYLLTPSINIIVSKWSRSLNKLVIGSSLRGARVTISRCLMLLTVLNEMQEFRLLRWGMEYINDDVRRLVTSWPKLRVFAVNPSDHAFISLSTLRIIAESCPELCRLQIRLDTFTIPPFDISSKTPCHKLEVLCVNVAHSYTTEISLESQIRMARHLDLIFPYLKSIEAQTHNATWLAIYDLVKLCQDFRRGQ